MEFLGIVLALISAVIWGGGDFTGGYASRRSSQYHVLTLSALSGLALLVIAGFIWREPFPSQPGILLAMLAGASGALGIAALYYTLSLGHAASVAPIVGVIGAAVPVLITSFIDGVPPLPKLLGFGLALAGIWLVSAATTAESRLPRRELGLACLAGVGFGGFFVFLGLVEPGKVITPLIIARCLTFLTGLALIWLNRLPAPSLAASPVALLAGILDVGGNFFYILARQFTRLDIAAVLASLYPASTVLLAFLILKEKVAPLQWIGVLICLAAIALIAI